MTGDVSDFVRRMRAVIPRGWFGDIAPACEQVLSGFGVAWQFVYELIVFVVTQTRIVTATGSFLDMVGTDFFGAAFPRRLSEADPSYAVRLTQELLRLRSTRLALVRVLQQLTGRTPTIVEPARPADTGGYNTGGLGFCVAGAWGDLLLSHACFVTAYRPAGAGIAVLAGYGTGGVPVYADISMIATAVPDLAIFEAVAGVIPLGCTAWVTIRN